MAGRGGPAVVLAVLAALAIVSPAASQERPVGAVEFAISSAPSPVGAGARAVGLGSAFVAVADDATAASWNPAGLSQLERPELSIVAVAARHEDDAGRYETSTPVLAESRDVIGREADSLRVDYASLAVPFSVGVRNLLVSLNYQQMLSFDRSFRSDVHSEAATATVDTAESFEQSGALYAISPAIAVELSPAVSIGAALNFWLEGIGRSHAWESHRNKESTIDLGAEPIEVESSFHGRFDEFHGTNAAFGATWQPNSALGLGMVVKLPFHARFRAETTSLSDGVDGERIEHLQMELPLAYGGGLRYRFSDRWMVSVDATRVEWSQFRISDTAGNEFLISGDPVGADNPFRTDADGSRRYHVEGVTTVRAGVERVVDWGEWLVSIRSGVFYDPEPSRGAPEDFYGASLGLGLTTKWFSVDAAYQARFGFDADGLAVERQIIGAPDATIDVLQQAIYTSLVGYW